jgi:hypothetical protein
MSVLAFTVATGGGGVWQKLRRSTRYGCKMADVVGAALHEDFRYHPSTSSNVSLLVGSNLGSEFAPDIFRFPGEHHLPRPKIPIPDWWAKQ